VACRAVVAAHPVSKKKCPVGVTRADVVYELFFTNLLLQTFTPATLSNGICIAGPWNWAISFILIWYIPASVLPPSHLPHSTT
jgi:hypothetical protein